jgi:hypothetical protein
MNNRHPNPASTKASGGIYINGHYVCRILKDNLKPEIFLENNISSKESPDILEMGDPA